jgi:SOS response regulatory protein OraA/RecX
VPADAFGTIVDALARRDLTSSELEQRLVRAGFDPAACAEALERASEAGYLSDARVALERTRRLAERDSSDAFIRAELRRRGLPGDEIEAALAEVAPELERAERLASRLGGGGRAARALVRKGYPEDVVERLHIADRR